MLKEYGVWSMGTGDGIRVFKDAWIPGLERNRIRFEGREIQDEDICVVQLIKTTGRRWNLDGL